MRLNIIHKLLLLLLFFATFSWASVLSELQGTKGLADKELKAMVEKLDTIGFRATAKNEHLENHYYNKFKEKNLDLLSFYTVTDLESLRELLIENPDFAAYAPFNLLVFKMPEGVEGSDTTWYGHIATDTMLDIIGEKDETLREKFKAMMAKLDQYVSATMEPTEKKQLTFDKPLPKEPLLKMVKKIGEVDDIEEFVEEFTVVHDALFVKNKFIIAGFLDVKFEYEDMELDFEAYDAFWVSSLCHFEFSNTVFNHGDPQAGIFAPCSVYFYIPKGSGELHVGYASVDNWLSAAGITDEKKIAYMKKISASVIRIFKELGFKMLDAQEHKGATKAPLLKPVESIKKEVEKTEELSSLERNKQSVDERIIALNIKVPTVPTSIVPKVNVTVPEPVTVTVNGQSNVNNTIDRSIKFSKRVPPNYISSAERYAKNGKGSTLSKSNTLPGDVDKGRIAAYLRGDLISVEEAEKKLKNAGFEIVAVAALDKKKKLVSVVFTNAALKKMAAKENQGYLGTLRLLVNNKEKQISITNPLYLSKAFRQNDFNKDDAMKILTALVEEFKGLNNSLDKLKFQLLPKYQFMNGMPYYKDHIVVARGDKLHDKLLNNKRVVYAFDLENGATLVGVKLSKRTGKFPKKIGTNNAGMLPYPLLIEKGEAKILDPKYYLALMYPQLTMEEFMTIATIPDAIVADCIKVFR